ncbi:zinc finger protein 846 [Nilaparvata lugens]|uniref:zinc finger protein 846 n=1 Tax=Nilaparvata lugens TaxID=108931 RepID=UPI00193C956C|nr:zinc finger protein 846 [Nilaparvata lugens]
MLRQLTVYLERSNLMGDMQHGFRKGRSTTSAVLSLVERIHVAFEEHKSVDLVLCGLTKAFDCVSHNILLDKLHRYGIRDSAWSMVADYLSDRRQVVSVMGATSEERRVTHGVPQGSVLGPLLFLILINNLHLQNSSLLYADDTTIVGKGSGPLEARCCAQELFSVAKEWFAANKLKLNEAKTQEMLCTLSTHTPGDEAVTLLGFGIDAKLSWEPHIDQVCRRLSRVIFLFRKLRSLLSLKRLLMMYHAVFGSHVQYGILLWGHSPHANDILLLQKKALQILTYSDFIAHCQPIFRRLKVHTVFGLYILASLTAVKINRANMMSRCQVVCRSSVKLFSHSITAFSGGALWVSPDSILPKAICEICKKTVDDWERFKEQSLRVNTSLQQFLDNHKSAQYIESLEPGGDKESDKGQRVEEEQLSDREAPLSPSSDIEHNYFISLSPPTSSSKTVIKEDADSGVGSRKMGRSRGKKIVKKRKRKVVKDEVKDDDISDIDEPNDDDENFEPTSSKWKLMYDRYQRKKYVCGVNGCDKAFSRFCDLTKHDLSDHADVALDVTCHVCGKIFISDDRLQIHVNIYHGEKKFLCEGCGDKFSTKDSLRAHKRRHSGQFVCQYCGLATNSNSGLIEHMRTHTGEKPFVCDICGQKHTTKNGLNAHKRGHTKEHLFKCNVCGYSAANQSSIYMHRATHSTDKPCICETCGKCFKIPARLAEHKKIHTGIKKFVCEDCNMSFLTRYQLTQHSRVHSGEKPFKCELCQKSFARRDNLKEHSRTHTREKRYTCERCLQTFSFRKSLNKHECGEQVATISETMNNQVLLYVQL